MTLGLRTDEALTFAAAHGRTPFLTCFGERGLINTTEHHPIHITLSKAIVALHIRDLQTESERLGVLAQLPKGAELQVCGSGFTPRTRRVESGGQFYFVFLQDLEDLRQAGDFSWSVG